jgi:hypothetical protein
MGIDVTTDERTAVLTRKERTEQKEKSKPAESDDDHQDEPDSE